MKKIKESRPVFYTPGGQSDAQELASGKPKCIANIQSGCQYNKAP